MEKTNKIVNQTREEKSTRENQWRPANLLEAPQPREGYVQRWIATSILGQDTPTNVAKRMREGWKPRDPKSVKEPNFATLEHGKFAGYIGMEGMVLCEMPVEMKKQRDDFYRKKTLNLQRSVDHDLNKVEQPGNPIQKTYKTEVTRGGIKE